MLFVASHRKDRAPGQRFRFEQYLDFLNENGFDCDLSFLVSEEDDRFLYSGGHYLQKLLFVEECRRIRKRDVARIDQYDIVFVFREARMTRSVGSEEAFHRSRAKVIYDFDDAVWLSNVSRTNRYFAWLKNPDKTPKLIGLADMVFAGNRYLADYASRFNDTVKIVPTTIDTVAYQKTEPAHRNKVCIGWSGSITTIKHFEFALPALRQLKEKFGDQIYIKVIGDASYRNQELGVRSVGWSAATEVEDLSEIDIGIMPLPDDEWTRGKCGLKGLQYMALGIATVMSPVGVNTEIIQDGVNGFLASSTDEWVAKMSMLIESAELREKLGGPARQTVIDRYSVESQKHLFLQYFHEVLEQS